jgi:hypothetical protein
LILSSLALSSTAAQAQDDESQDATAQEEDGGVVQDSSVDFGAIDDLLAEDEEVLTDPDTYSYDPGVRRDPFRSLIKKDQGVNEPTKRPEGIAGLLIEELEIEGVFMLEDGPVVQVKSATEETSFLLRQGDELWDGDVVKITLEEVVFKQSVNDPTVIKPFREVVKKLDPAS